MLPAALVAVPWLIVAKLACDRRLGVAASLQVIPLEDPGLEHMSMGFTVSTDVVRQAAALVSEAHQFFNAKLAGLQEIVADSADKPFVGRYGQTGAYQGELSKFDKRFREVFQEFIDDEVLFVTFLQQLHVRLNQNAALYDATEEQNVQRLSSIAKELDGQ